MEGGDRVTVTSVIQDRVTDETQHLCVAPDLFSPDLRWLDDEVSVRQVFLAEVPVVSRALAATLFDHPDGYRLLSFLVRHPRMAMTASDLAYMIGETDAAVGEALRILLHQGIVRLLSVEGLTLYRLSEQPVAANRSRVLSQWYTHWLERFRRLDRVLGQRG
jgi:DNA-binding transcriptional ArsR family regulator